MRVLVVDDDPELAELLSVGLGRDGHEVEAVGDLKAARGALRRKPELVVLDVGLPDGSGLDWCRELRRSGDATPVLLLTARSSVGERVEGLDAGADDYLGKPFALAELRARVRVWDRRQTNLPTTVVELPGVTLDVTRRRAERECLAVELTAREWEIVEVLAAREGAVVGRARLLEEIWGERTEGAEKSMEVLIGRIRRKLGRSVIRTIRGHGYALG